MLVDTNNNNNNSRRSSIVEHDYSRGPYWPAQTYDMAWSVEFLEHVGVNYQYNYISTLRKAAIIVVTSSRWGGWHHVEVHWDDWWIQKLTSYGLIYDETLTARVKQWVREERRDPAAVAPNGEHYHAQHLGLSAKVFVNPAVASLPQHAHLLYRLGCEEDACPPDDRVPASFLPLPIDPASQAQWEAELLNHTTTTTKVPK
mmetsp:Transcript_6918/g.19390  ORF Transcript_6918/g.19390 Transcript_6918/m.19390 type:complete len:201 (-) Transcript_6918:125-727(-)